jgi:LPS sulfotransferase NodH
MYVIAMLPRTGSTALCSLLVHTQRLGYPDEYLNPRGPLQRWMKEVDATDLDDYLVAIRRERTWSNGVFGLKATLDDLELCVDALERHGFLSSPFIYLTRDDVAAQAVSQFIAEESGVWHRDSSGKSIGSETPRELSDIELDERRTSLLAWDFIYMHEQWEEFFRTYRIEPLRLTYEDLCADATSVVKAVANHVGLDWEGVVSLDQAQTSLLRDDRSSEWADRIRAHMPLLEQVAEVRRSRRR